MTSPAYRLVAAVAAAVIVLAVGIALRPTSPVLAEPGTGDPALVADVRALLDGTTGARNRISVAVLQGDAVRVAHFGALDTTQYEVGSITKTVTASLLIDAIERGEVRATTRVGDLLPLQGSPAVNITLQELATHSSGLPRLSVDPDKIGTVLLARFRAADPYGATSAELVDSVRRITPGPKDYRYSNLGFALLGQALASAAGKEYPTLARERVFAPLGMDDSFAPTSMQDLADDAATGFTEGGRASQPWTLGADAPAGSVRSTLADMVRYARAQRDRTAPGVRATEPLAQAGPSSTIGYAWHTTDDVTWHNGATGGFTSWLGFDRRRDRAVVVLSNTATSVDNLGWALMGER